MPDCPATAYLYWLDDGGVSLFRSTDEHQHEVNSSSGLPHKTKEAINQLIADGINKPNAILQSLSSRGIESLTKAQLKNYLARYRLKKFGAGTITIGELKQWCIEHADIPLDDDTPFAGSHNVDYDEHIGEQTIQIFFTTKRLIQLTVHATHVCTDGTYKLIWQGYPVLMVGSTDANKKYHPFGIAITLTEDADDFEFIFESVASCTRSKILLK